MSFPVSFMEAHRLLNALSEKELDAILKSDVGKTEDLTNRRRSSRTRQRAVQPNKENDKDDMMISQPAPKKSCSSSRRSSKKNANTTVGSETLDQLDHADGMALVVESTVEIETSTVDEKTEATEVVPVEEEEDPYWPKEAKTYKQTDDPRDQRQDLHDGKLDWIPRAYAAFRADYPEEEWVPEPRTEEEIAENLFYIDGPDWIHPIQQCKHYYDRIVGDVKCLGLDDPAVDAEAEAMAKKYHNDHTYFFELLGEWPDDYNAGWEERAYKKLEKKFAAMDLVRKNENTYEEPVPLWENWEVGKRQIEDGYALEARLIRERGPCWYW